MTTNQSNVSNFAADVLRIASLKSEGESGPIYLAHAFAAELAPLLLKVQHAATSADAEKSVRSTLIGYWEASPQGEAFLKDRAALAAVKDKTAQQKSQFDDMDKRLKAVNIMLFRTINTFEGVSILRKAGMDVNIARIAGSNSYACYVKRPTEFEHVRFSAAMLQKVADASFTVDMKTTDVRAAIVSHKQGAANKDKGGNGTAIAPSALPGAVTNLDTTVAGLTRDTGIVAGPNAKHALAMLWARLDSVLTAEQKAEGRKAFAAEGDKQQAPAPQQQAPAPVAPVVKPAPVKQQRKAKAK